METQKTMRTGSIKTTCKIKNGWILMVHQLPTETIVLAVKKKGAKQYLASAQDIIDDVCKEMRRADIREWHESEALVGLL